MTREYVSLFNTLTDVIEEMEGMIARMKEIQQQTEESIISKETTKKLTP